MGYDRETSHGCCHEVRRRKRSRDGWQKMRVTGNITVKAKRYFETYYTGEETRVVDSKERGMNLSFMRINLRKTHIWRMIVKYAAILLFPLCVGFGYWLLENDDPPQTTFVSGAYPLSRGTTKAVLVFNSGQQVKLTDSIAF